MMEGPTIHYTDFQGRIMGGSNEGDELAQALSEWNAMLSVLYEDMKEFMPEERIITLPLTTEENTAVTELDKLVSNYWKLAAANFVTGAWDIDEYWSTYISELEAMGIKDLLAMYQAAYDRTK